MSNLMFRLVVSIQLLIIFTLLIMIATGDHVWTGV